VVSNLNPKLLYLNMFAPQALPPEFREHTSTSVTGAAAPGPSA